jgi:hypothetical protein
MLTNADVYFSGDMSKGVVMAIAFGIENEIVHTMPTYTFFYDLIQTSDSIVCDSDDCTSLKFLDKSGKTIETLTTDPKLGSVLASSPKVFEILRRTPDNSAVEDTERFIKYRHVVDGWTYEGDEIIPPVGWYPAPTPSEEALNRFKSNRIQSGE